MQALAMPISPIDIVNTAIDNPEAALQQIAVNSAAQAISEAINPTPEQQAEKERAQQEQGRKDAQVREQQQKNDDQQRDDQMRLEQARRDALRLEEGLQSPTAVSAGTSPAEVLKKLNEASHDDGVGFDAASVELAGEREKVVERITNMRLAASGSMEVALPGLDGFSPEIPFTIFERAGVIRLSLQDEQTLPDSIKQDPNTEFESFDRGPKVLDLPNGEKRVKVRLEYSDGTVANTELKFSPTTEDAPAEVIGTIAAKPTKIAA